MLEDADPDPALTPDELRRLLEAGREHLVEGRLSEAEATLREALARTRGLGSVLESRASGTLGTFYGIVGRTFEAMLLYRHALAIDVAREDWAVVVLHHANLAAIYSQLGLDEALRATIAAADDALAELPPEQRPASAAYLLWPRVEDCLGRHDLEGAKTHLAHIREAYAEPDEIRVKVAVLELEADMARRDGRHAEALAFLDEGLVLPGLSLSNKLDLLLHRIHCLEDQERWADAKDVGLAALDLLQHAATHDVLAEQSIAVGAALAACFEHGEGLPNLARRAYDLAAGAVLERIRQLEACVRDLPELANGTKDDAAWLTELRQSFHAQQAKLLERVATLLEEARAAGLSPLHREDPDDHFVRICAWCGSVLTRRGHWIPVSHFVPSHEGIRITHTICGPCSRRLDE